MNKLSDEELSNETERRRRARMSKSERHLEELKDEYYLLRTEIYKYGGSPSIGLGYINEQLIVSLKEQLINVKELYLEEQQRLASLNDNEKLEEDFYSNFYCDDCCEKYYKVYKMFEDVMVHDVHITKKNAKKQFQSLKNKFQEALQIMEDYEKTLYLKEN